MFHADAGGRVAEQVNGRPRLTMDAERKPVLVVLHQLHSNAGHIGRWFMTRGHALDVRRPRFENPLPETLEHHSGAVIFGSPMSAQCPRRLRGTEGRPRSSRMRRI
jgi:hypothetical protein